MTKKRKIIIIASSVTVGLVVTYFAGGLVATSIITNMKIDVRGSNEESLQSESYRLQYNRDDLPALAERQLIPFTYAGVTLQGYYYPVEDSKGLVMTAHGVNSMADGPMSLVQNYFVTKGWSVFSFDMIGCGRSGGKGMKSLHESRPCINAALKAYKEKVQTNKDEKLCLVGHSWGGYGSLTGSGFDAVAAFSAFNQSSEMMYAFAASNISPALIVTKPALDFALTMFYGNAEFKKASDNVKKNKDTKYMIIHGDQDDVVPLKKYSAYACVNEKKCTNVTKVLLEGMKHTGPWKTNAAHRYLDEEVQPELDKLHKQYGKELPKEVLDEFIAGIDKEKASEVNTDLMDQIEEMFLNS